MNAISTIILMILALTIQPLALAADLQEANLPYVPGSIADSEGNEWLIEQNGTVQQSGAETMIGNCMSLQFGNQQFYTQQAMTTADGRLIVMPNNQAVGGVRITRRIYLIEGHPVLLYVEEFHNITSRDLVFNFEVRHNLNHQAREITSNLGRPIKDSLEPKEKGLFSIPGENEKNAPALLFMMRTAAGATSTMKTRVQNKYQISIPYSITIPAGQVRYLVHGIAQVRSKAGQTNTTIAQNTSTYALERYLDRLPKTSLKLAINLGDESGSWNLADWLPSVFWGVTQNSFDQWALGQQSILKGQAILRGIIFNRQGEAKIKMDPSRIAALAGSHFTRDETSWICLRDGQRWKGQLEAEEMNFSPLGGSELPIQSLEKLILRQPSPPFTQHENKLMHPLIELRSGERIAIQAEGDWNVQTAWGTRSIPWSEIVALHENEEDTFGQLLCLKDGTRLKVLTSTPVKIQTVDLGQLDLDGKTLQRIVSPIAESLEETDQEPTQNYLETADKQRIVGQIKNPQILISSETGVVPISPHSIREMKVAHPMNDVSHESVFDLKLWAGGNLQGKLLHETLSLEGKGYVWNIPCWHIERIVNPSPSADAELLRKIATWIHDLGSDDWKSRETATRTLRELGPLALVSLKQERQSTKDAEMIRRLDELINNEK